MKTLPAAALPPLFLPVACLAFGSRAKALTSFAESGRKPVVVELSHRRAVRHFLPRMHYSSRWRNNNRFCGRMACTCGAVGRECRARFASPCDTAFLAQDEVAESSGTRDPSPEMPCDLVRTGTASTGHSHPHCTRPDTGWATWSTQCRIRVTTDASKSLSTGSAWEVVFHNTHLNHCRHNHYHPQE